MKNLIFLVIISCGLTHNIMALEKGYLGDLGVVVVTPTRGEHEIGKIAGRIDVITKEDIKELNAKTVDEALKTSLGIDFQDTGMLGHKVTLNMRGTQGKYGCQQVLILQDGRPVNEEYLGDFDFRLLPTENIERIEIVHGPGSALYGENATGGVINIITKNGKKETVREIHTSIGSYNSQWYKAVYGAETGNFHHFTTLGYDLTDGYLKNSNGTNNDWKSYYFSEKIGCNLSENSDITASLGYAAGIGTKEDFEEKPRRDYEDLVYKVNWNQEKKAKFSARVYRNGFNQSYKWKFGFTGEYEQFTLGGQVQQSYQFSKSQFITAGIDFKTEDVSVLEFFGKVENTVKTSAFYLQDEIDITKNLKLTLGGRYDHNDCFGEELSPRVSLLYAPTENTSYYVSYAKGWRAPKPTDLYQPRVTRSFPWGSMTFEGNPDLKPSTKLNYEFGVKHIFFKKVSGEISFYKSDTEDEWDFMLESDGIYRTNNITQIETYGYEGKLDWKVTESFSSRIIYNYTEPKYKKYKPDPAIEGNICEDISKYAGVLGLSYKIKGHMFNLNMRHVGPRFTNPENANKLSSFTVLDFNMNVSICKGITLSTGINNFLDEEYYETEDYKQPGRTFFAGLSAGF